MKRKNNNYISNLETVSKKNKFDISSEISNKRKFNSDVFSYICQKFKRFKLNYSMNEQFENIFSDFTNCNIDEEKMENVEENVHNQSTNPYFIDIY